MKIFIDSRHGGKDNEACGNLEKGKVIQRVSSIYQMQNFDSHLRDWAPEHEKMRKAITLSVEELKKLRDILNDMEL